MDLSAESGEKSLKLLLIRHGESLGNQDLRMQGQLDDPLSVTGQTQVKQLGQRLAAEFWRPTHIYSSPLKRAAETVEGLLQCSNSYLSTETPLAPAIDYREELKEIHAGIFQGLTWVEASQQYPELCTALESSSDYLPIPGAEAPSQVRARVQCFIEELLTHPNDAKIWIISHGGILQHLISELLGSDRSWGIPIRNTALFEFWIDGTRWQDRGENRYNTSLWQILHFNSDSHLHYVHSGD